MIRRAAAVVLVRGSGERLEVFVAERSPKLRFLGGYFAFPGGVEGSAEAGLPDPRRACAIRELFEETGVLLGADRSTDVALREKIRAELLASDGDGESSESLAAKFQPLVTAAAGEALLEICRFMTPPFAPVRYDTDFYLARLPDGEEPRVVEGELVSGRFVRPAEALRLWRDGSIAIAPPVLILLEILASVGVERFPQLARGLGKAFAAGLLPPVRFTPGIVMASLKSETIPPATTTNSYLVGNERVYLVDPGTGDQDELDRLSDFMVQMEKAGRTLEGILLTHHHPDHVAGLAWISEELDLEIRAHELTLSRVPGGSRHGAPIVDGEKIPLGTSPDGRDDWSLRAIFTPGHARGHLCFLDDRYHALIAGDMVSTLSTIVIDPPEGHLTTYLESLARLRDLPDLGTLYPSHGPPAPNGRKVVERYIAHRGMREEKLIHALDGGARTDAELVAQVYDDVPPALHPIALRSLTAGIDRLAELGKLSRDETGLPVWGASRGS